MKKRLVWFAFLLLGQGANLIVVVRMLWAIIVGSRKAVDIAVAYDRLGNVALNGNGKETISSRANRARAEGRGWGCTLCSILDAMDPDHCKRSDGI